jgi:hypothetical protein
MELIGKRNESENEPQVSISNVVLPFDDLEDTKFPVLRYLMKPAIRERSITQIFAIRESFKTLFAQSIAISIATGKSNIERWEVLNPRSVLYVDGELAVYDIVERIRTFNKKLLPNLSIYPNDAILDGPIASLTNSRWRKEFKDFAVDRKFKLVIFDNMSSLAPGIDENSKKDWSPINQFFLELKRAGIAVIFIHHAGKTVGRFSRGHSSLEDSIDCSILIEKTRGVPDGTPDISVTFTKFRALIGPKHRMPKRFVLKGKTWCSAPIKGDDRLRIIVGYAIEGMSSEHIGKIMKPSVTRQDIDGFLNRARARGLIDISGLTEAGSEWLGFRQSE